MAFFSVKFGVLSGLRVSQRFKEEMALKGNDGQRAGGHPRHERCREG